MIIITTTTVIWLPRRCPCIHRTQDTGEFEQLSIDQYPLGYMDSVDGALATSYGYNLRNMLTSIETDTGLQTEYLYDASGARAKKTVNGASTSYIWNGSDVVYEKGKSTAYYCYGDGILSMINADGACYHLKNGHGDVTQLITPFRYCGEYFDEESGFIYLRNRYYDSATDRFITEDPVKDWLNWYAYCGNNPVMFVVPWGLEQIVISGGEYKKDWKYKYNFIEPAIKKLKEMKESNDGELVTWLIANEGWKKSNLKDFKSVAQNLGIRLSIDSY